MFIEEATKLIIEAKAITIRDTENEPPFVYSSGNQGPGYVMVKGLVGRPATLERLCHMLAEKIRAEKIELDFIEGNATGGMIPGWVLSRKLSGLLGRDLPFCYLRESRKRGGHNELITGNSGNENIKDGAKVLIVEELVNFAETTVNASLIFREAGYKVEHAACILFYNNPIAVKSLEESKVSLISLIVLEELLMVAQEKGLLANNLVNSYLEFLRNPVKWQIERGLPVPEDSVAAAKAMGYNVSKLDAEAALAKGAPKSKLESGFVYYG